MITLKNVKYLREQILKNGYSFAGFAKSIGISRSCLDKLEARLLHKQLKEVLMD